MRFSASEQTADWDRWHELLDMADIRELSPDEKREYDELARLAAQLDEEQGAAARAGFEALMQEFMDRHKRMRAWLRADKKKAEESVDSPRPLRYGPRMINKMKPSLMCLRGLVNPRNLEQGRLFPSVAPRSERPRRSCLRLGLPPRRQASRPARASRAGCCNRKVR